MAKPKLHFQLTFSKNSETSIKCLYKLSPDDEILMGVWFSDRAHSIFERNGFIITKDGFGWNYAAIVESMEKNDSTKERLPRNFSFLSKKDIRFLGTDARDTEVAAREDGKREIQLRTSEGLYIFGFDSGLQQKTVELLERAIASNFADAFDASLYEKADESYSLPLTLITIKDFFGNLKNKIHNKIFDFKRSIKKYQNEKSEAKEKVLKQEASKSPVIKSINKIGSFFRHIVDFCTDILLMFAILIFVKPQLLMKDFMQGITATIKGLTFSFFYYDLAEEVTQEIIEKRNFLFVLFVTFYFILKIFISLSCRKNRKAVTAILFILLISSFFLVAEKFILFGILLLLILLAMQFSMGFSIKVVKIKMIFFVIVCITGYIVLHIILYENFTDLLKSFVNVLSLPVKWW